MHEQSYIASIQNTRGLHITSNKYLQLYFHSANHRTVQMMIIGRVLVTPMAPRWRRKKSGPEDGRGRKGHTGILLVLRKADRRVQNRMKIGDCRISVFVCSRKPDMCTFGFRFNDSSGGNRNLSENDLVTFRRGGYLPDILGAHTKSVSRKADRRVKMDDNWRVVESQCLW